MAELDYTNIAASSIATPASGVTAMFVDLDKNPKIKDDTGQVVCLEDSSFQSIATAGGTTTFTNQSPTYTIFTGTSAQTVVLPDATTMTKGCHFQIDNDSTLAVTVNANGGSGVWIVAGNGGNAVFRVADISTSTGVWDVDYLGLIVGTGDILTVPTGGGTAVVIAGTQSITGVKTMTNPTTAAGTTGVPSFTITAGTLMTSPTAGVMEADSAANYATINTTNGRAFDDAWNYFRLASNGGAISTIADLFGSNDGIPTVLNGVYEIEWHCYGTVATGGTMTFTIVNTQTVTNMVAEWVGNVITGIATTGAVSEAGVITQTAASVALPVTGLLSAASHIYVVHAVIEAGTAGNVRLRGTMSAGTWTSLRDSYFKVRRLPAGNAGTFVA